MSDGQGSPPPGHHPDLHYSPSESVIPIYGVVTTNDSVYNSFPEHINVIRHYDTQGIQLNLREHIIPEPTRMDYPERSRQTDICRQLPTYSFAGDLRDSQISTRLPDHRLAETIPETSSTNYSELQYSPNSYPGPSVPLASPHQDIPNLRKPHMGYVHPYPNKTSAAELSHPQPRRGTPHRDEFQMLLQPPSRVRSEGSRRGSYHLPSADAESSWFNPMSASYNPSVSSIPISNPDWSRNLSSAISGSPLELDYPISSGLPPTTIAHSFSKSSAAQSISKKKKSKMHECTICGKWFPRPSGLRTHMNTHNNQKPFQCEFPGCSKTFTVRSNAKRHRRIHGDAPDQASFSTPPLYTVGFNPPTIAPIDPRSPYGSSEIPVTLRWMPLNLTTVDPESPAKASDDDDSEDDFHDGAADDADWR